MRAMHHILTHTNVFFKSERIRRALGSVLGRDGLSAADYDTHKRQNPAFGQPQIRALTPVFCEKANQLRDILLDQLSTNSNGTTINVLQWLTYATLDIIGVAGFGYEFNSLRDGDEDELAKAFNKVFDTNQGNLVFEAVKGTAARAVGMRIGSKIVADKKALLEQEEKDETATKGRDILSILIRSNMAQETVGVQGDQTMSDDEVLGQISTFLAAGHETTSTTTTWALYALSKQPYVQGRLRKELQDAKLGEEPSMVELEKLTYLDNVIRETLRLYPAVPMVSRMAFEDAVIPVGQPYKDRYGVTQSEIRIQKWDTIRISISSMNRAKDVWGEDALEFRYERFIEGPNSCIGYRFAVVEMKALLYSLLRSIEFSIDPSIEIVGKTGLVTRPCVKSQLDRGNQMPLICKLVSGS
ncbi:hypothetical protein FRC09_005905 [Ceratobasidium sp. 395]|nr:hypothetical protein FRC09_005905 [Ceratobasidium sp. 395]